MAYVPSQWPAPWLCTIDMYFLWCVSGRTGMHWCRLYSRFGSIFHYDWNLFKARFIGPDGVPLFAITVCMSEICSVEIIILQNHMWYCGGLRRWKPFGTQWNIRIGFANIPFCHRLILALVWKCFLFGGFGEWFLWDPFELLHCFFFLFGLENTVAPRIWILRKLSH